MAEDILSEILGICLAIDQKACSIYSMFSSVTGDEELKSFWKGMSDDESKHIGYWSGLLDMVKGDDFPGIFENPADARTELETLRGHVEEIVRQSEAELDISKMFFLAYRMEFSLLNSTVITLLHFLETLPGEKSAVNDYEAHIERLLAATSRFGSASDELKLLGEVISGLWRDRIDLFIKSQTDELSGILNRRGLFSTIRPLAYLAQRNNLNVGVLIFDIDDFKSVNDRHGHQKGDRVIALIGDVLQNSMRRSDVVGRYGGEEFLVFLSDVAPAHVHRMAENLRQRIELESQKEIPITVSIGIATGRIERDIEKEIEALIKKADERLYEAKTHGKDRVRI